MRVLMGAASKGTVVEISIDGPDEIEVAKAVKIALVRSEDFK
jgi:phosphotransferase system HPr-like phosphotransfer protein